MEMNSVKGFASFIVGRGGINSVVCLGQFDLGNSKTIVRISLSKGLR